jgi:acyl-CoA thioester hydrolase
MNGTSNESELSRPRGEWRDGWYVIPYHVLFRDLDAFGHVNNAVFLTYFEWGRTLMWFNLLGWGEARDIDFVVARVECDYKRQVSLEPIEIAVRISEVRTSSFDFLQEVRTTGGAVAASGRVVVVLYDWARQSKVAVSDELRRTIASWNPDVS